MRVLVTAVSGKIVTAKTLQVFSGSVGSTMPRGAKLYLLDYLPGDSSLYQDGNGNYSTPSATGGAGWVTALDTDFTAESSQTLTTDGNYTIGGQTWVKVNSANDATAMSVTNGTGLVIVPKSPTVWALGTKSAPAIELDMGTIISGYYIDMPLRIWVYVSADNSTSATLELGGVVLDNLSTTTATSTLISAFRGNASLQTSANVAVALTTQNAASAGTNADRVMMIEMPTGRITQAIALFNGQYSSGWPSVTAMRPWARWTGTSTTYANTSDVVTGFPMKLVLTGFRNGTATALSFTIARVMVQYKVT